MASYSIGSGSRINITYFTGTGGTAMAARALDKTLTAAGAVTRLNELTCESNVDEAGANDFLIVCYPVYAFTAPRPVLKHLKRLSASDGTPAAVISVSGGGEVSPNLACRRKPIRLLERRGYRVVYENMLVMPANAIEPTPDALARRLLAVLPDKAEAIASAMLNGVERRSAPDFSNRMLAWFGRMEQLFARLVGKLMKVSGECTACGLCAAFCPTGNIRMVGEHPAFAWQCVTCLRCVYNCPAQALRPRLGKMLVIDGGYSLSDYESGDAPAVPDGDDDAANGKAFDGVRDYLTSHV